MTESKAAVKHFLDARCHWPNCHHAKIGRVYRMIGSCLNCKVSPILGLFTAGHEASEGVLGRPCPVCGTLSLTWSRLATEDEILVDYEK